jgi:hypothetical protein
MRLWSLHPRHLDAKGLVALWREGLLALAVLEGKTHGYRHHPQLERFARCRHPARALAQYLRAVLAEAAARGYAFDPTKVGAGRSRARLTVTRSQRGVEWRHLLRKLHRRDRRCWAARRKAQPEPHPMFEVVPGPVEAWERMP